MSSADLAGPGEEDVCRTIAANESEVGELGAGAAGRADDAEDAAPPQEEARVKWMWGDAGVVSGLARLNPMRWSAAMEPGAAAADLAKQEGKARPVELAVVGQKYRLEFASAAAAASWLSAAGNVGLPSGYEFTGLVGVGLFLSSEGLAVFCRMHARTPYLQRNFIMAYAYARRTVALPYVLAKEQRHVSDVHTRRDAVWADFDASDARWLTAFVAASDSENAPETKFTRPESLTAAGREWKRVRMSEYHTEWRAAGGADHVVAWRGGDGGLGDACDHPGSPCGAFINGEPDDAVPPALRKQLPGIAAMAEKAAAEGGKVYVVGYSQGGIPAVATALALAADGEDRLHAAHLLNAATMFWPRWMGAYLGTDWWGAAPPPAAARTTSWLVRDDPLSEGVPGGFRAPQFPGKALVLPRAAGGKQVMDNHKFAHFCRE
eukprot:TRINITY_DN4788_c0_g1_i1.p2 TRINITY_DN4788_c0_g1~~TRINITY_DN4788_c0_g1_i1.p2  ORF type:complete len:435 (+),score=155.14 TRINITY_DN4788_c0_g1_i1:52-1356(+)